MEAGRPVRGRLRAWGGGRRCQVGWGWGPHEALALLRAPAHHPSLGAGVWYAFLTTLNWGTFYIRVMPTNC